MDRRLELQTILENILGSRNVYFQPPSNTKLSYPCIIYNRSNIESRYANNDKYNTRVRYSLMLIGRSPESELVKELLKLPYCSYDRFYTADTLNHDTFTLYY
jgi:hypothetical protein